LTSLLSPTGVNHEPAGAALVSLPLRRKPIKQISGGFDPTAFPSVDELVFNFNFGN
jgi:hypothetical protein